MDYRSELAKTDVIGIRSLITETVVEHRNVCWEQGTKSKLSQDIEAKIEENKALNQNDSAAIYASLLKYSNVMGENFGSSSNYLKNDILRIVDALDVISSEAKKELFGVDFKMDPDFRNRFWKVYEKDVMNKSRAAFDLFSTAVNAAAR